jgi:hypothetical protein
MEIDSQFFWSGAPWDMVRGPAAAAGCSVADGLIRSVTKFVHLQQQHGLCAGRWCSPSAHVVRHCSTAAVFK